MCRARTFQKRNHFRLKKSDGKRIEKGIEFLSPYVEDKNKWPFEKDVMYWEHWPVAHPFLGFGAQEFNDKIWFDTWKAFDHDPKIEEVIRNLPIRNPIIWLEN